MMTTNDPYRAQTPAAAFPPIGATTRWVFASIVAAMGLGFGIAVFAWAFAIIRSEHTRSHQPDETYVWIGVAGMVMLVVLLYAQIAAGLVWVYKAWSWLPPDQRYTRHWKSWITPGQASLMLLIPYFHYYWMFIANLGLCDALDRMRVGFPTREAAPKSLAIAACVCQIFVPFPIASVLWLVYMAKIERMTREMGVRLAPSMF
jgi:hypothetical protein